VNLNFIYSYYPITQTIQNYPHSTGLPMVTDTKKHPKDINPEDGNHDVWKNTEEPSTSNAATEIQRQKTLCQFVLLTIVLQRRRKMTNNCNYDVL
jgi:hypothetical protein